MASPFAQAVEPIGRTKKRRATPRRTESSRNRAAARQRALSRLAQEYRDRYQEIYDEERQVAS